LAVGGAVEHPRLAGLAVGHHHRRRAAAVEGNRVDGAEFLQHCGRFPVGHACAELRLASVGYQQDQAVVGSVADSGLRVGGVASRARQHHAVPQQPRVARHRIVELDRWRGRVAGGIVGGAGHEAHGVVGADVDGVFERRSPVGHVHAVAHGQGAEVGHAEPPFFGRAAEEAAVDTDLRFNALRECPRRLEVGFAWPVVVRAGGLDRHARPVQVDDNDVHINLAGL